MQEHRGIIIQKTTYCMRETLRFERVGRLQLTCCLELCAVQDGGDAVDCSVATAVVDVDALSVDGLDAGLGLGDFGDAFFESDAAAALSSCFAFGFGGPLNPWKDLPGGTVCISRGFHQLEMLQQGQSIIFHSETTHSACPGE